MAWWAPVRWTRRTVVADVVETLTTREMLVQIHWGPGIKRGAEISSGTGGMGTSACVSIDAEFFQRAARVVQWCWPSMCTCTSGLSPLTSAKRASMSMRIRTQEERSSKWSKHIKIAGLPIGDQGGPVVKLVVAVRVPAGEDLHQLGVGVGGGLGGDAESAFLE